MNFWNYRLHPEAQHSIRIRALRGLFLFLALMVGCTLVSRAADTVTVVRVEAEKPKRAPLTHTLWVDGTLEPTERMAVTAQTDALVKSVAVAVGDAVKEGDLLFAFDTKELQKELEAKNLELQKLRIDLEVQREKDAAQEEKMALNGDRAMEDYDAAAQTALRKINAASRALRQARQDLRDYGENDTSPDEEEDEDDEDLDPEYIALRDNYREKKQLYDEALAERANSLREAERVISDTALYTDEQSSKKLEIDCRLKELEISKLQTAIATGGEVYAPADGVVSSLLVDVGKRTTSEAAVYLTGTAGLRFEGTITQEEKKRVEQGMEVELELSGEKKTVTGLELSSVKPLADQAGIYQILAELPDGGSQLRQGENATAKLQQKTAAYETCVPLSALFYDGPQAYVLAVREVETALGLEQTAERVNVTVLDHSDSRAAVEGPVSKEDRVIVSGTAPVGDGDRIRLTGMETAS